MPTQTKKITIDTAALFVGKAVGLLLGLVRLNYLATYLGLDNFGVLNSALYFTSVFQPLFDLGLSQLLTREMAKDPERGNPLLGRVIVLKLAIALLASAVVGAAAAAFRFDEVTNWAVLLTTAAMAVNSVGLAYLSAFQAQRRMVLVSIMTMFGDMVLSVGVIALLPGLPGVNTVLLLTVAVALVNLLALVTLYNRVAGPPPLAVSPETWRLLLREGFPIAVSSFGASMYMFISPNVLKYTRGNAEVGVFGAGYKLVSILALIPLVLTQVLFPLFSDFAANSRHKLGKALQDAVRVTAEISVPLAVGTLIVAPEVIRLLYPPVFADAATVLRLVIVGNAFGFVAWVLFAFLISIDEQQYCMWNALAVACLVLMASILVVPRFGYLGAAAINGATDIVLFLSLATFVRSKGYHLGSAEAAAKIIGATAVMAAVALTCMRWGIFAAVPAGICAYGATLFMLRAFGDQERELLSRVFQR